MAEKFEENAMKHKIIAIAYIVVVFFVIPTSLISILR